MKRSDLGEVTRLTGVLEKQELERKYWAKSEIITVETFGANHTMKQQFIKAPMADGEVHRVIANWFIARVDMQIEETKKSLKALGVEP